MRGIVVFSVLFIFVSINIIGFNNGNVILLHQIPGTHSIIITDDRTLVRLEESGTQYTYYQKNDGSFHITVVGPDTDARTITGEAYSGSATVSETGFDQLVFTSDSL